MTAALNPFVLVPCECVTEGNTPGRRVDRYDVTRPCPDCSGREGVRGRRLQGDPPDTGYGLTLDFRAAQLARHPEPLR